MRTRTRDGILREHFATLAALYDEATFTHLRRLGIRPGWTCWEVGAGNGTVAAWMAEQTSAQGSVLATDLDTSHARHLHGVGGIEVRRHDVVTDPAPAGRFDLIHARLVLEHVADVDMALAKVVGALRPGGVLLVESADPQLQPQACPDEHGDAETLANRARAAIWRFDTGRIPVGFGRTLPRLLRGAGLRDVGADIRIPYGGPAPLGLQRSLTRRHADRATGLTREETTRHLADLDREVLDVAALPLVSAWGSRKDITGAAAAG